MNETFPDNNDRNPIQPIEVGHVVVSHAAEQSLGPNEFEPRRYLSHLREVAQGLEHAPGTPKRDFSGVTEQAHSFLDTNADTFKALCASDRYSSAPEWMRDLPEDHYYFQATYNASADKLKNDFVTRVNQLTYISWLASDQKGEVHLSDDRAALVMQEVYDEWLTYHQLRIDLAPYMHTMSTSLLWRSIHALEEAFAQDLPASKEGLFRNFASNSRQFPKVVERLANPKPKPDKADEPRNPSLRELQLNRYARDVLANPRYEQLSDPSNQAGAIIECQDFEDIDDAIFAVVAANERQARERYGEPERNVWSPLVNKSVAEKLQPKGFYGRYTHQRVAVLPTEESFLKRYLSKVKQPEEIDQSSIVRLCAIVDLESTGRGVIGESLVDIVVYTRNAEDPTRRQVTKSVRGGGSGQHVADYLHQEASDIAIGVLTKALRHPLSGGLPGHGKLR